MCFGPSTQGAGAKTRLESQNIKVYATLCLTYEFDLGFDLRVLGVVRVRVEERVPRKGGNPCFDGLLHFRRFLGEHEDLLLVVVVVKIDYCHAPKRAAARRSSCAAESHSINNAIHECLHFLHL